MQAPALDRLSYLSIKEKKSDRLATRHKIYYLRLLELDELELELLLELKEDEELLLGDENEELEELRCPENEEPVDLGVEEELEELRCGENEELEAGELFL